MRRERPGHTLQTTALVNEAYVRLLRNTEIDWRSRAHFYAVAARTMRRVLVDYARAQAADKRGGGAMEIQFDEGLAVSAERCGQITELDDALKTLSSLEERVGNVIELRFFAGLSFEETAEALGISVRTAKRDWEFGRAWLRSELESQA
jgi:RNA polymerase sigma factor (TIGR02999 family)